MSLSRSPACPISPASIRSLSVGTRTSASCTAEINASRVIGVSSSRSCTSNNSANRRSTGSGKSRVTTTLRRSDAIGGLLHLPNPAHCCQSDAGKAEAQEPGTGIAQKSEDTDEDELGIGRCRGPDGRRNRAGAGAWAGDQPAPTAFCVDEGLGGERAARSQLDPQDRLGLQAQGCAA